MSALPQIITGSHDKTVKMWDLRKGKTLSTLTYHKKSIRAMAAHPQDFAFAAGSADNIKKYRLPQARRLTPPECSMRSCTIDRFDAHIPFCVRWTRHLQHSQ